MLKDMLAIIPARGGSKGLPNKNILELDGKPLIAHTVEAAIGSKYIDDVIVSTDSEEIAKAAVAAGAENPFMRPEELASDTSRVLDTFIFTLNELKEKHNREYKKLVVLQPTSPLRNTKCIDEAIELYNEKEALTVMSVKESEIPLGWYLSVNEDLSMEYYLKEALVSNRQENRVLYIPNGAIYVFDVESLLRTKQYYNEKTYAYKMKKEQSLDIDDIYDFLLVKAVMQEQSKDRSKDVE